MRQRWWPPLRLRCPERTLVITEVQGDASKIDAFYDEHMAYIVPFMKSRKVLSLAGRGRPRCHSIRDEEWSEPEAIMKGPFTREGVMQITSHTVWNACEAAK